jgi:hypothetical protein
MWNATTKEEWAATAPVYLELREQIHGASSSAADCVRIFVDRTILLAADAKTARELDTFVTMLDGSMCELAARTPYQDDLIRSKLVDFIHHLQKAVIKDPQSVTGQAVRYWENDESVDCTLDGPTGALISMRGRED